jgi:ubiquinone/menaquinone biosynthesis C-methylase UbiE
MSDISNFANPDTDPDYFVQFLDQIDELPAVRDMRAATAARLVVDPDCKVLDLGCGVGAATFAMAERVGPAGLAAGVDISPALIDVATRRAQGQSGVEFRIGEVTSVPYPDGFFDAAYCERVFLYLPDRLAAIGELQRVVRPGGQVWLVDTEAQSTAIYSSQRELTRKLTSLFASALPNPNSARELSALAKRAGLRDLKVELFAVSTPYRFLVHAMGGVLAQAAARGQIEKPQLDDWLSEQASLDATSDFFQAWLFVRVMGTV